MNNKLIEVAWPINVLTREFLRVERCLEEQTVKGSSWHWTDGGVINLDDSLTLYFNEKTDCYLLCMQLETMVKETITIDFFINKDDINKINPLKYVTYTSYCKNKEEENRVFDWFLLDEDSLDDKYVLTDCFLSDINLKRRRSNDW